MESKADSMASTPTLTRSEEGHQKLAADSVRRSSTISKPPSTHSTHSKSSKDVKATDKGPAPAGPGLQAPIDVPRWRFWAIFISVMLSIFLFALDQLILATATPAIVSDFGALSSLAWMANGFFLTLLGFNLIYSQWNQIFPSKVVLIFAIFIFELGSLVCAVSNSMVVLILGRAITGVGASGLFSGGMIIIAELTPLHNRAQYLGLMGAVFAVASVLGPLIGGAFTDHVSWRWCFYINLPFGGLAIACIALFQPLAPPLGRAATYKGFHRGMIWDVLRCDWVGCGLSMAWAVVLILWLQWGGQEKKWSDGGVITCIVLSIVLIPIFIAYEYWMGERAMFKLALLKRRTISGASILLFWLFGLFMAEVYYISVAFQSVYHISATGAGVRLLPFVMTQIVVLMASSRIVPKIGRFKYVILAGPVFLALGSILLYTVKYGTSISHLMGFEVFLGIGIGLSMQNTMLAVQFELKKEPHLISAGTGLSVFIGFGGRILGLSLAGNIFGNMLKVNLRKYASDLPATLFDAVVSSSDSIWTAVPENLRPGVLKAYAESLRLIYILGLPMACLAVVGGLLMKNSKMQTKEEEMQAIQAAKEKAALAQGEKTGGEGSSKDAVQAGDAERFAEDITVVAPQPVVSDPRVVLDKSEGKSPV